MADNKERLDTFEKLVGKEKVGQVMAIAEKMSTEADKFLASKEKKEDDVVDETAVEDKTEVKDEAETKEFTAELLAMKEEQTKVADELKLAMKEQGDKFDAAVKDLTEKNTQLQQGLAEAQRAFGILMGIQPKANARGYKASEQGDEPTLNKEEQKKVKQTEKAVKTGDDFIGSMADFVIHGKEADAVGA